MSRDLASATQTGLQAGPYCKVLIGRLDIASDPVYVWTGPGILLPSGTSDAALNGYSFSPAQGFVGISSFFENMGIGRPVTATLTGHDMDQELMRQVVRDKRTWRLQPAYIWAAILDTDKMTVLGEPFRMKTGVMTNMTVTRTSDSAVVSVTIDEDVGKSRETAYYIADHPRLWAADTYATYVAKLANKPNGLGPLDVGGSFGIGASMGQGFTSAHNFNGKYGNGWVY